LKVRLLESSHFVGCGTQGRYQVKNVGWAHIASAEGESIAGSGAEPPASERDLGAEPLVRGLGATTEAENLSAFGCPKTAANSPHSPCFANWRFKLQMCYIHPPKLTGLHQSQEPPLTKVGWTCPPQSTRGDAPGGTLCRWTSRRRRHWLL